MLTGTNSISHPTLSLVLQLLNMLHTNICVDSRLYNSLPHSTKQVSSTYQFKSKFKESLLSRRFNCVYLAIFKCKCCRTKHDYFVCLCYFWPESNFFLVISFIWKRYLCRSNYEIGISGNKLVDGYTDLFTMTSYSNSFVLYVFSWWWINKLDADGYR